MAEPAVLVLAATDRGVRVLERVCDLCPGAAVTAVTFPEDPWEPPFVARFEALAAARGVALHVARRVERLPAVRDAPPPDLLLAVSWRHLVPRAVYERARIGAFAFHDSLLPAYRGFAPTPWAILNGETATGATLLAMAEAADAGGIVGQAPVPIGPADTVAAVMERVTQAYLALCDAHLPALLRGEVVLRPQDEALATYTCKRLPSDNRIDWTAPTRAIDALVRAATRPYPGAFTTLGGATLRIWAAAADPAPRRWAGRVPGRVAELGPDWVLVLTGDGALRVEQVSLEDGPPRPAREVLRRLSDTLI